LIGLLLKKVPVAVILLTMILLMVSPAWADSWFPYPGDTAPKAYTDANINTYTRGQCEDFYINYNGYNQGNSGAYHVGSQYPTDVWDQVVGENRYGYTAVTSNEFNSASGDVQNFLQGFQFLTDTDPDATQPAPNNLDYLIDEDFLQGTAGGQNSSFIVSSNIRDGSMNIIVKPTGETRTGSSSPDGYYDNNVQCISNTAAGNNRQGFLGEGWFQTGPADSNGNYTWEHAEVYSDPSSGYPGPINLTQQQANWYMHNSIGPSLSSNSQYPTQYYPSVTWHGQCGVSFPYNIFVSNVQNTTSGNQTTASWNVTNQTPLYLQGIKVRVYTKGLNDGKWMLQDEYDGLDMPPVERDTFVEDATGGQLTGGLTRSPANKTFPVNAEGLWSVMSGASTFPTPSEPYITVVTADVNLNVANGSAGPVIPTYDHMTSAYWAGGVQGATPPGLPAGETVDWPGGSTAALNQSNLGVALSTGYNDNVGYSNQTPGYIPPGGGNNPPPTQGYNLKAVSLTQVNSNTLSFAFENDQAFPENGNANVYFYMQANDGYLTGYGQQSMHITVGRADTITTTAVPFQPGDVVYASVDATSSDGTNWTGQQFQGDSGKTYWEGTNPNQYTPSAYYDNYICIVIPGNSTPPFTPAPQSQVHPAQYTVEVPSVTYQTETVHVPVYGWKEVPYAQPPAPRLRARLIPPPPGWDEYGNQTGQ
jgi:hypothetical protein